MKPRRNSLLPAAAMAALCLLGGGQALAADPPALDQKTIDELLKKAEPTPPPAPPAGTPDAGSTPATPPAAEPAPPSTPSLTTPTPPSVPAPVAPVSPEPSLQAVTPPEEPAPVATPASLGDALWELVQGSEPLTLTPDRTSHRVGERLALTLNIPRAGYLNILGVGPDDQPKVLYPNKYVPDNQVKPGEMKFPPPNMPVAIKAEEPAGKTRLFALLSEKPLNLYTVARDGGAAAVAEVLEPYLDSGEKADRRALFHGARLELQVCPTQGPCP